jgi:hypothetical protein
VHNIIRSPLYDDRYRHTFSGHETFPLRYGWLKKSFDAVAEFADPLSARDIFTDDSAIARFGVGKNMVTSMRHWATACGVLEDAGKGQLLTTDFGNLIFGRTGIDPYLENPASLWLLHWQLASYDVTGKRPNKTTWHWVINHFPGLAFDKDDLIEGLTKLAETRKWSRLAPVTIRNDVDCFLRTYESRPQDRDSIEDALSSPLAELGLIRGHHKRYQLIRGAKRSLPNAVFVFALEQFWRRLGENRTLSFEVIAHEPGSPGRVFLLDESDLAERLLSLEEESIGAFRWSETAGLKQVLRAKPLSDGSLTMILKSYYARRGAKEAA